MTLPNSGFISLDDIQTEFGGTNPILIDEYYGVASGVPASGAISLADFYGATAYNGPPSVDYQMIGGGGGGAGGLGNANSGTASAGGGGGAGGYVTGTQNILASALYTITIGGGGASTIITGQTGTSGGNTSFHVTTANGGGGGGSGASNIGYNGTNGANGGCGGGGGASYVPRIGGTGSQGYDGGTGFYGIGGGGGGDGNGAGGGGIASNGQNGGEGGGGSGGTGAQFIDGVFRGGGGAGGGSEEGWRDWNTLGRAVGVHGGGNGSWRSGPISAGTWNVATSGTANTGGGGGGGQSVPQAFPASGGSGICIIYYPNTYDLASTTGSPTYSNSGGNHIYTFTGSGTITF